MTTPPIYPGERLSAQVRLSPAEVGSFARSVGDTNPLHRDQDFAGRSRFGKVIASGPHTSALLMGFAARHFSASGSMVGVNFSFYFRAPTPVDDHLTLEWLVIRAEPRGDGATRVDLRGRIRTSAGVTTVGAKGQVLVWTS